LSARINLVRVPRPATPPKADDPLKGFRQFVNGIFVRNSFRKPFFRNRQKNGSAYCETAHHRLAGRCREGCGKLGIGSIETEQKHAARIGIVRADDLSDPAPSWLVASRF